jgi:hypothetical protein
MLIVNTSEFADFFILWYLSPINIIENTMVYNLIYCLTTQIVSVVSFLGVIILTQIKNNVVWQNLKICTSLGLTEVEVNIFQLLKLKIIWHEYFVCVRMRFEQIPNWVKMHEWSKHCHIQVLKNNYIVWTENNK